MGTFFVVACGQIISNLGSSLTDFGLGVWIFQETGSATQFALSILITALPRILLAPIAGALIDRWDRKRIMLFCDTVLAGKTLAVLLLLSFGSLHVWHVYLLNAAGSIFGGFHSVAWSASTTLLVPRRHLARVSGLTRTLSSGTGILAPALAGVFFVLIGLKGIAVVDLASWAFAVVPLVLARIPSPPHSRPPSRRPSLAREIRDGWLYMRSLRGLLYLLLMYSAIGFFGITTEVLRGPYVLAANGPEQFGLVESVVSIGTLAGGLLMGVFGQTRRPMSIILGAEFVVCITGILMGALPAFWMLLASVFLYNAAVSWCDGTIGVLWQLKVRPKFQGRVFALRDTLTMSVMPIGILVFSPVAEFWMEPRLMPGGAWAASIGRLIGTGKGRGIGFLFVASGIICLIILGLSMLSRDLRRADTAIPDAAPGSAAKSRT